MNRLPILQIVIGKKHAILQILHVCYQYIQIVLLYSELLLNHFIILQVGINKVVYCARVKINRLTVV